MHWLTEISAWHWASLGIILLIMEILGTAGFLIGSAIAAFLMAAIISIAPDIDWKWQLAIFSSTAIVFSIIYLKRFANFNEDSDQPHLNKRAAQHIGKRYTLNEAIVNGQGRIQVGDTFWKITCDEDLEMATQIEVTGVDGMTLKVKAAD
ncbi:MAG: NfeD family protein [Gammaproteobacteria bacterium]|nr:NfeD family protein [Gammaproteobacteria bacterium]